MHEAALHGGPREASAQPGCFVAAAGVIAVLALHATPGGYAAGAFLLTGAAILAAETGARYGYSRFEELALPAARAGIVVALAAGFPAVLRESAPAQPFWTAGFLIAGAALWRYAGDQLFHLRHSGAVRRLPVDRLPGYAETLRREAGPANARDGLVLAAVERLAAEGELNDAVRLAERLETRDAALGCRLLRVRSVLAFLGGDLNEARRILRELLARRLELDTDREARAWGAYLELASGRPADAAILADSAVGPQIVSGEAWFAHCRALQAWALLEQGEERAAIQLAQLALTGAPPAGPEPAVLRALISRAHLQLGERNLAHEQLRGLRSTDSFVLGQQARCLAAEGSSRQSVEAAERAVAAGERHGPFARALALVDRGYVLLVIGDAVRAEADFRAALECWHWLPAAEEGLVEALLARGDVESALRVRSAAAREFPQHRVALERAAAELPA